MSDYDGQKSVMLISVMFLKHVKEEWDKLPLKWKAILTLIVTAGVPLFVMTILCIIIVNATNLTTGIGSHSALHNQIEKNVVNLLLGSSNLYTKTLNMGAEGYVGIFGHAISDMYRANYSMGYTDSYFEYGDTYLAKPLTQDERQSKPVSFNHSAYYVPGAVPADISTFTQELNDTRDLSVHVDTFIKPLYKQYIDFVAGYIGFENTGLFRHYPGTGTIDTDPTRSYDPRIRGWYIGSKDAYTSTEYKGVTYSEPYRDFNGKGWMITLSQPIFDIETGQFVGVAGSDMLINTIKDNIQSLKLLESGKVTLFEISGIVVADREWDMDPNDPNLLRYDDLTNPKISNELWTQMVETNVGEKKSQAYKTDGKNYIVTINRLSDFGTKYLLATFVLTSEITKPIDKISTQMILFSVLTSIGLFVLFVVVSVAIFSCVIYGIHQITAPLDKMEDNIRKRLKNIGSDSTVKGLEDINKNIAMPSEIQDLIDHTNTMWDKIEEERKENTGFNPEINIYFDEHEFTTYQQVDDSKYPTISNVPTPTAPIFNGQNNYGYTYNTNSANDDEIQIIE